MIVSGLSAGDLEALEPYDEVLYRDVGSRVCPIEYASECTCASDDIGAEALEDTRLYLDGVPLYPAKPTPENVR